MSRVPRVFFHVQHLLGIGHLKRAAALARALGEAGFAVDLASGGEIPPGLDFGKARLHSLPPVRSADERFSALLDATGQPIDDAWRENRKRHLLDLFAAANPDILLIEMFPFGRRQFRFELLPLIAAARAGARRRLIVSSVRDILVDKGRADRRAEAVDLVRSAFDLVLVHGDPRLAAFESSFPEAPAIADRLRYTGYVVEAGAAIAPIRRGADGPILVSAGGGAVGFPLLEAAIAAKPLSRHRDRPWHAIAGLEMPEAQFARLRELAPRDPHLRLERFRPDFAACLAGAFLSISQGGYNTVMEILAHNVPALLVPFAAGGESEQRQRAILLAQRGRLAWLDPADLTPGNLAAALDRVPIPPPDFAIDLSGAAETARQLEMAWRALG